MPGTTDLAFEETECFYRFNREPRKGRVALSSEYAD
jgi:hypothetical protein